MIGERKLPDKLEVLGAVDVSVMHELKILLIHTALDRRGHAVHKHSSFLSFLD